MYGKLNSLRSACNIVGIVALLIFMTLRLGGSNSSFLVIRLIIAVIAYSIECGAEAISDEKLGSTIFLMAAWLFYIIHSAIMLI